MPGYVESYLKEQAKAARGAILWKPFIRITNNKIMMPLLKRKMTQQICMTPGIKSISFFSTTKSDSIWTFKSYWTDKYSTAFYLEFAR